LWGKKNVRKRDWKSGRKNRNNEDGFPGYLNCLY
jgi:hypothetical protein